MTEKSGTLRLFLNACSCLGPFFSTLNNFLFVTTFFFFFKSTSERLRWTVDRAFDILVLRFTLEPPVAL